MFIPKNIIYLFIVFLVFPSGIGVSFLGNNLDVNKIVYLFCLVLTAMFWYKNSHLLNNYDYIPILIIFSAILFTPLWLNSIQYLIFFLNVVLLFSAFYIGRIFFLNEDYSFFFIKKVSIFYIAIGILALLDFRLNMIPLEYLRPNAEAYIHEYSRGTLGNFNAVEAYKGFFAHTHYFSMDRLIWLSLSLIVFILFIGDKRLEESRKFLLISSFLGFLEIVFAQTRYLTLIAILIFVFAIYKQKNRTWIYLGLFYSLPLIFFIFTTDTFQYYYNSVSTLFVSGMTNELGYSVSYVLENDKRYLALEAIYYNLNDYRTYLSYGPLMFNYSSVFLGAESDFFDDLSPVVLLMLEYGLLFYLFLCIFIFRVLLIEGYNERLKKCINFLIIVTILSSIAVYNLKFLMYLFFFLGAGCSLSLKHSVKSN